MKFSRLLMAVALVAPSFQVQAAAIASIEIVAKWNTLSLVDNVTETTNMIPTSIALPATMGGGSFSSAADGKTFYNIATGTGSINGQTDDFSDNDAPMSATYNANQIDAIASYEPSTNESRASVIISNTEGFKNAGANSKRNALFEATSTGRTRMNIDIEATAGGSITGGFGGVNGAVGVRAIILNFDTYLSTFVAEFTNNGGDEDAADDAAFTASLIKDIGDPRYAEFGYFTSCPTVTLNPCPEDFDFIDTLQTGFDVVAGTNYLIEFEVGANALTDPFSPTTVVPVPAAVWLFGSGLLGLVGVARRKQF